jgi:plasmid replication initiation protein
MDKLGFAGLLATLYDSARSSCKRGNKKALAQAWAALPGQGLPQDKHDALRLAFKNLNDAQLHSELAVSFLMDYYGMKRKEGS